MSLCICIRGKCVRNDKLHGHYLTFILLEWHHLLKLGTPHLCTGHLLQNNYGIESASLDQIFSWYKWVSRQFIPN